MPSTAPLGRVQFRSLLLPPMRIGLRRLHTLDGAPCPAVGRRAAAGVGQRRSLHLYKTARAKTALGMQKILDFRLYEMAPPSASAQRVRLVKSALDATPVAEDVSLQELYEQHMAPGRLLYLTQTVGRKLAENYAKLRADGVPASINTYAMVAAHSIKAALKNPQTKGIQLGPLKGIHLALANPTVYTKEALDRAYQFIEQGSPVEFRVRLLGAVVKKKGKTAPTSPDAWPWMHAHFPHLRPDFILKSMPERTEYLIQPVSDGRTIQFVLGRRAEQMPKLDLTRRLFRVKRAVAGSQGIDSGAQRGKWEGVSAGAEASGPGALEAASQPEGVEQRGQVEQLHAVTAQEKKPHASLRRYRPAKQDTETGRRLHERQHSMDRRGKWKKGSEHKHSGESWQYRV